MRHGSILPVVALAALVATASLARAANIRIEAEDFVRCSPGSPATVPPCPDFEGTCPGGEAGVCVGLYEQGDTTYYEYTETGSVGFCGIHPLPKCLRVVTVRFGNPDGANCRFDFGEINNAFPEEEEVCGSGSWQSRDIMTLAICAGVYTIYLENDTQTTNHVYFNWFELENPPRQSQNQCPAT